MHLPLPREDKINAQCISRKQNEPAPCQHDKTHFHTWEERPLSTDSPCLTYNTKKSTPTTMCCTTTVFSISLCLSYIKPYFRNLQF